jgi:hypothetical protein
LPFQNYDVYIETDGVTRGFVVTEEQGVKNYQVGLAPTLAPQQRLTSYNLYEGQPPEVSVTSPSETWHNGAGISDASGHYGADATTTAGYYYSRGVDLSEEHAVFLSPYRNTTVTSDGSAFQGHPIRFIETTKGVFCITEYVIYKWSQLDSWWELVDSHGNYKPGALEHDGYIYVPRGTSAYIYSVDGYTWVTSSRVGVASQADAFCNRGDDGETSATYNVIVRLRGNAVSASTDGLNSGVAWSTEDEIGSSDENSKFIAPDANNVIVWKEEGVYTFDFQNVDNFWSSSYNQRSNADHVYQWVDGLWYANYGTSVFQFDFANSVIKRVYPLTYMYGDELMGKICGITGSDTHLYIAVKNEDSRTYIMKGHPEGPWHSVAVFDVTEHDEAYPASGTSDSSVGSVAWTDPSNITSVDSSYASFSDGTSEYLLASDFGFDIPGDAVVTGVTAIVSKDANIPGAALVESSSASWDSGSSITWSHTTSGDNRLLVVGITYSAGQEDVSVTGVTFNGDGLTLLNRKKLSGYTYFNEETGTYDVVSSDVYSEVWSITDPVSATGSIVVSLTGTTSAWGSFPISFPHTWGITPSCVAASFEGVDQSSSISVDSDQEISGAAQTSISVDVETPDNSYVFSFASAFGVADIDSAGNVLENVSDAAMSIGNAQAYSSQNVTVTKTGDGTLYLVNAVISPASSSVVDSTVRFFVNGVASGNNLAKDDEWGESFAEYRYGSSTTLPAISLSPTTVNSSSFGIGLSATTNGNAEARVNYVEVTVYFNRPGLARSSQTISVLAPGRFSVENPTLLSGFGEGVVYYILPRSNMTPATDENYLFQTHEENFVVGSWVDFGGSAYSKFLNRGTVLGDNITAGKSITLEYETEKGVRAEIVSAKQNGLSAGNVLSKVEFNRIRYIISVSTTSPSTSPSVYGWTLQSTLNQPRYRVWSFVTSLVNEQSLVDGNSDYYQDSAELEEFLFNATKKRPIFTDINGRSFNVRIADIQSLGFSKHVIGNEERVSPTFSVKLLEIGPLSTEVSPLTYGSNAWGRERDWS